MFYTLNESFQFFFYIYVVIGLFVTSSLKFSQLISYNKVIGEVFVFLLLNTWIVGVTCIQVKTRLLLYKNLNKKFFKLAIADKKNFA